MVPTRRSSFSVPSLPPLGGATSRPTIEESKRPPMRPPPPRSRQQPPLPSNHHFLGGINLDHCSDLLSIPDPPSPQPRNRRRQSSPLLLPLRDVTNNNAGEPQHQQQPHKEEDDVVSRKSQSRRARKSLCHVPSPIMDVEKYAVEALKTVVNEADRWTPSHNAFDMNLEEKDIYPEDFSLDVDHPDDASRSKRRKNRESMFLPSASLETNPHGLSLYLDDSDDVSKSKRRKKRESMFVPSSVSTENTKDGLCLDLDDDDNGVASRVSRRKQRQSMALPSDNDETKEYFQHLQSYQGEPETTNVPSVAEAHPEMETEATNALPNIQLLPPDKIDMDEIRSLVRGFCSLPLTERSTSKQAAEIERLTGYPLIPSAVKKRIDAQTKGGFDLNWSSSPSEGSGSQSSLESRRDVLLKLGSLVENMDKRKVSDVQQLETMTECRVARSGKGKYRYFHILTNERVNPLEYQQLYLYMLEQSKPIIRKRIQQWLALADNGNNDVQIDRVPSPLRSAHSESSTSAGNYEDSLPLTSAEPADTSQLDPQCDDITREIQTEDYPNGDLEISDDKEVMDDPKQSQVRNVEDLSPILSSPFLESQIEGVDDVTEQDYLPETLLHLPSRDETSCDPDIAIAEEKLWTAIDSALETYSREVMAIQDARRRGQTQVHP